MSDRTKDNELEGGVNVGYSDESSPNKDWDRSNFPVSTRPILKVVLFLALGIAAICALVYSISDFSEEERAKQQEIEALKSDFLGEESP